VRLRLDHGVPVDKADINRFSRNKRIVTEALRERNRRRRALSRVDYERLAGRIGAGM
jgi:hypothetical protein